MSRKAKRVMEKRERERMRKLAQLNGVPAEDYDRAARAVDAANNRVFMLNAAIAGLILEHGELMEPEDDAPYIALRFDVEKLRELPDPWDVVREVDGSTHELRVYSGDACQAFRDAETREIVETMVAFNPPEPTEPAVE